jgi:DNA-binding NarL/FixJ family response regulator
VVGLVWGDLVVCLFCLDAVYTYISQGAIHNQIDHLLGKEKILFCCYSRLLATLWVRSERGRYQGNSMMPEHLSGSCTTSAEALELFARKRPTLVISTQLLEEGSGIELISAIKERDPHMRTLLFLQHNNLPLYHQAVKTHSDGIVLETEIGSGHIVQAIKTVSKGGMYLEPCIAKALAGSALLKDPGMTARELEIMHYVVCGFNDREIGEKIYLATDTVKYHLKQIYAKLGIHNRTRAAITMVLMGLVEPPNPLIPGHEPSPRFRPPHLPSPNLG